MIHLTYLYDKKIPKRFTRRQFTIYVIKFYNKILTKLIVRLWAVLHITSSSFICCTLKLKMLEEMQRYQRILHENNQHIIHRQSLIILSLKYVCNILKKLILRDICLQYTYIYSLRTLNQLKTLFLYYTYCREQKVHFSVDLKNPILYVRILMDFSNKL